MNTETLFSQKEDFFDYLRKSGRCENILRKNKCIVNLFEAFCISNKISKIENEVIELFYSEKLDLKNRKKTYQYTLKRPIISFLDYYDTKQVKKRYDNKKEITIFNLNFKTAYKSYKNELILNSDISYGSKMRKERIIITFLNYLTESSIEHIGVINQQIMTDYINLLYKKYSKRTVCCYKCVLKEFINYLHKNGIISFSGNFIMSSQRTSQDSIVASSFKKEELSKILNSIDTSTKIGKHNYLIMALLVYYGLRAGDIANLKFSNIDFEKNMISIIQSKTKVSLTLPLIDMVKYPLLDYLKNARPNVSE